MDHPGGRRRGGRALQAVGFALMGVALTAALTLDAPSGASVLGPLARAELEIERMVALAPVPNAVPSAAAEAPAPVGPATPRVTPTPKVYQRSRSRFLFNLSGSLSLGSRQSSQTQTLPGFGGPTPSPGVTPTPFFTEQTTSQGSTQANVGMLADISRRSSSSAFDVKLPLGFVSNSKVNFGQISLLYSTARFGLGYGSQNVSAFGQLPIGSTLRGEYAIVPISKGDLTLISGPTIGAQTEQIPMQAVRYRLFSGRDLFELGYLSANGPATGRSSTLVLGAATSRGSITAVGEGELQNRAGGDATVQGPTYQLRVDDGSLSSYLTAITRRIAPGTVQFGAGEYYGDNFWDIGFHKNTSIQSFAFDTTGERLGTPTAGVSTQTRGSSLSWGGPLLRFGTYNVNLASTRTSGTDSPTLWTGNGTLQMSGTLGRGFVLLGSSFQRSTQSIAGNDVGQVGLSASVQQPIGTYFISTGVTSYRQTSQVFGATNQTSESAGINKNFFKTNYGIQETFTHSSGALSNAVSKTTQYSVTRQISPAFNIAANYLVSSLNDRINPSANNRSHSFSIQVNAPFAFGNGIVSGAADPHLPATILGRVLTDTSSNPTFASLITSGVSNVQIVLDDKYVQRTDVSGGFQFSFVNPGQHQLRVESASLPRGVTVDIPVYTVNVDGGQVAQVSFLVGNFGGVQGHVYGTDDQGRTVPLPHVTLRIDGGTYSQTDLTGAYGFGRLRPGKHKISVIESTVPAFATMDEKKATTEIDVHNGTFTTLDFSAEPLGSIAGSILYDEQEGPDSGHGVSNAYVVAEPGEHAAIVDDDGSFIIDNLPAGQYTVSVDGETVPQGLGAAPDSIAVSLGPQEHYQGAAFKVGHTEKKVVFSFVGSGGAAAGTAGPQLPRVHVSESRLPPKGTATITVDSPESAKSVEVDVFDRVFSLAYDAKAKLWRGEFEVPTNVKAGTYPVTAKVGSGTKPEESSIVVDAKMPLVIMHVDPANPQPGQYVRVRARFLVDVVPGDRIQWQDGQMTTLGRPLSGRVFTFNVRISLRPLHGLLLTKGSSLPISIM